MARDRVLIVYPILHHYRYGVFNALSNEPKYSFEFVSDVVSSDGIEVIPPQALGVHHKVTTRRIPGLTWQSGLLETIKRTSPKIVIFLADAKYLTTWIGSIYCRIRGIKVVHWTIGWHRPEKGLKKALRLRFYKLADSLLLYGRSGARLAEAFGYPRSRISVIGNSWQSLVEGSTSSSSWDNPFQPTDEVVGAVIRLNSVKKLDQLFHAVHILNGRGSDIKILLAGDGPERSRLEGLAYELGIDVHFAGALYDSDSLAKVYKTLKATVVPAAVGLTAIQSLMHGTPVVSNDCEFEQMPEWEAIKPGVTGEIFQSGSPESLADAISRCLARVDNEPGAIASACRREARDHWSPEAHARRIIAALDGLNSGEL